MTPRLKVVQAIAALHLDDGGPSRSVSQLAAGLLGAGLDVHLVAGRDPGLPMVDLDPGLTMHWIAAGHTTLSRRLRASGFAAGIRLALQGAGPVVLHTHGIWLRQSHDMIAMARKERLPVVLSPRGMLEPWALAYRAWRKRLAWWLYQRRDLRAVTAFHATSDIEANSIRRLGMRQPVIMLPNGVELPAVQERVPPDGGLREALFLSRIHPKKGIDLLIRAWAQLRPPGWRLTIAGNDDGGHVARIERQIRAAGLGEEIRYVGPAYGCDKERRFRAADLFLLPSHSENFGIVVAEALAYGVPVITTTGTPWAELVTERCGWHVPVTVDGLATALAEAVAVPAEALAEMGARGRRLVEARYDWQAIARQLAQTYQALQSGDSAQLHALPFVRFSSP